MKKLITLVLITIFTSCKTENKTQLDKPNIVFIFADDMTYSAINALGNHEIQTPNLDKLVSTGTSFLNTYNMGSWTGAVCAASRAMIISGRSVWDVNKFRKNWTQNKDLDKTWGE